MNVNACDFDPEATIAGTCEDFTSCVGCMVVNACNYDPEATINGSCIYYGCTIFGACNYDPGANSNDGSCDFTSCIGCMNTFACDYDPNATIPGECTFPEPGLDCEGNCEDDEDEDGICDEDEIPGCTNNLADNYDEEATDDDGSCIFNIDGCMDPLACNYNFMATNDDESCEYESCIGCLSTNACNYDPTAIYQGDCVWPEENYDCDGNCLVDTDGDGVCDIYEILGCTDNTSINWDVDATDDDGSCIPTVLGCIEEGYCNYNPAANVSDDSCEIDSCTGCMEPNACNFNEIAIYPDTCVYEEEGYDCDGVCLEDADADGICDMYEVTGCTDPNACGYNPDATDDDGSCYYVDTDIFNCDGTCLDDADGDGICDQNEVVGCTDPDACGYNPDATDDDGSCFYVDTDIFNCDGTCIDDADGDGVCDQNEVVGCTDHCACNYNADATDDDESCTYDDCSGCMYANALNYDANAIYDDGSCEFEGCIDSSYTNYNPLANVQGDAVCSNSPSNADFTGDNFVQLDDLLQFLTVYSTEAPNFGDQVWAQEACDLTPIDDFCGGRWVC